jgi:DNA-binding SARP family transcriptional activator/tetratricopeptide (TPR) repeat protein
MVDALRLFGAPAALRGGAAHPLPTDLRTALLGVLAVHRAPIPRERAAAVFWPDKPTTTASQNLRQLLHRSRALVGRAIVTSSAAAITLTCDHDLHGFDRAVATRDALTVARLGVTPLLDGLEAVPNPEWQAWLDLERRVLREQARRVLLDAAAAWQTAGPTTEALATLAAWVDDDPFDDDVHAAYLRCAGVVPSEASAAAERLSRVGATLERELGAGLAESVVLASTWLGDHGGRPVRAAMAHAGGPVAPAVTGRTSRGANMSLPLVGRSRELDMLDALLRGADTRLVTVHGPGGIGKSRLLEAWAERRFPTGAPPIVDLAAAFTPADAARAVAQAHGWHLRDDDLRTLAARAAAGPGVLLLDAVDGRDYLGAYIAEALAAAPSLAVVVASRERLGMPGEQLLPLRGLEVPVDDDPEAARATSAVHLFLRAAKRVRPDLRLEDRDLSAVARFARRVHGSPLALTVAAGLLQLGPPHALLDDILDTSDDPLAIDDVIGPSWARLAASDRDALEALSVFPGRFDVEGATRVAACDRRTLVRLVDHSLVEPGTDQGLTLHALVQHHAARQLASRGKEARTARERHARYVAERLGSEARHLRAGPLQRRALESIVAQLPDLRQAWAWACETRDVAILDALADTVWALEIRGWYELATELSEAAVTALGDAAAADPDRASLPLARALARRGIPAMRLGDVATTRESAERARGIFEQQGQPVDPFVWFHLGIAALLGGDLAAAESWHRRLLQEAAAAGDDWALAGAHGNLGLIAMRRGDSGGALDHLRRALDTAAAIEDGWGVALGALNLAEALAARGGSDDTEAIELLQTAIRYQQTFGMATVEVMSSRLLGQLLLRLGRPLDAERAFLRARQLIDTGVLPEAVEGERAEYPAAALRHAVDEGLRRSRKAV